MNQPPATSFDFWTLFFSGFAFIGLFYSLKILVSKWSVVQSRILGIYLLLQSIAILEYVLYWTKLIYALPVFSELSLLFPLLYGPLLLIYLNISFGNDKPLKDYTYHFLPFIVALCFKLPFYFASPQLRLYHTHDILFGKYFDYYPWVMLLHLSTYGIFLALLIRNQTGVGDMRLWAKWLVVFFGSYVALSCLYYVLVNTGVLTTQSDYFISLATCATIFLIAWYGQGFDAIANGKTILDSLTGVSLADRSVSSSSMIIESAKAIDLTGHENTDDGNFEKYQHSGLPKSIAIKLAEDMERLMQKEKLYHANDLRLEALAEKLNSNKHFVSQVINQNFRMNFFEYINVKRIEEAKQLLKTTARQELNVIEIAYAVGFNNKGTFNSVFKKVTGMTPTEFRNQSSQLLGTRNN